MRTLHSFPTRRSSDLLRLGVVESDLPGEVAEDAADAPLVEADPGGHLVQRQALPAELQYRSVLRRAQLVHPLPRSEEHTSELQSRQYLVCPLLLEKKK